MDGPFECTAAYHALISGNPPGSPRESPWFAVDRVSFAEPIQWLGTDFLESIQYKLYSGGDLVAVSDQFTGHPTGFGGIYSDVPFDAAILRDPAGGTTVDNLYFQRIVPAPGALAISTLGLVLSVRRRRRRAGPCDASS